MHEDVQVSFSFRSSLSMLLSWNNHCSQKQLLKLELICLLKSSFKNRKLSLFYFYVFLGYVHTQTLPGTWHGSLNRMKDVISVKWSARHFQWKRKWIWRSFIICFEIMFKRLMDNFLCLKCVVAIIKRLLNLSELQIIGSDFSIYNDLCAVWLLPDW